jgi:hypothetical protein
MICPKCKENAAHRAERVGFVDHAVNRFYFKPYACGGCSHRFYALRRDLNWPALREELRRQWDESRRKKQRRGRGLEWAIYLLVGLAVFGVIYLLMQQRS